MTAQGKELMMDEWREFLAEGKQYLKATEGKNGRHSKLSNDIRYNLLALSVEKSIMAMLLFNNDLADNHTFRDLLHSVEKYVAIPETIRNELLELEQMQTICNVFEYHRETPSDEMVVRLMIIARYLSELAMKIGSNGSQVASLQSV